MPYLVDGHNLIPKIPGLSLRAIDDEQELIDRLTAFCAREGQRVEVFFDGAPPGFSGARRYGRLTAHFVQQGRTADEAISRRLVQLGRDARNWTVVSSDRQVRADAHAAGAKTLTSEEFASRLQAAAGKPPKPGSAPPPALDEDDLDEWLRLFGDEP